LRAFGGKMLTREPEVLGKISSPKVAFSPQISYGMSGVCVVSSQQQAASCLTKNTTFCIHEIHLKNYAAPSQETELYLITKSNL